MCDERERLIGYVYDECDAGERRLVAEDMVRSGEFGPGIAELHRREASFRQPQRTSGLSVQSDIDVAHPPRVKAVDSQSIRARYEQIPDMWLEFERYEAFICVSLSAAQRFAIQEHFCVIVARDAQEVA
jgi:hypothetical protein